MPSIYLSHVLTEDTPLYGASGEVKIQRSRCIDAGDTSNNSNLALPAHAGTHIDAPFHFDHSGRTLDSYSADFWYTQKIKLLEISVSKAQLVDLSVLGDKINEIPKDCECLLLKSGFEVQRQDNPQDYMTAGPGIGADLAQWLRENRQLRFVGMDFVSTSSFQHREIGRETHRIFLKEDYADSPPILLIEDMALQAIDKSPASIHIVPIRFENSDGAPVTVIAELNQAN